MIKADLKKAFFYENNRIIMGTVQLGLDYGVNTIGQPTEDETFKMLRYALDNGLNSVDTAPVYGESETRIGKFIKETKAQNICVTTKLEAQSFPDETWDDEDALCQKVREEFNCSCRNLNLKRIPVYILHFADQSFRNDGIILKELVKMKKEGYIEYIGTSLYTGEELEKCIDDKTIDLVQIPFSILDRRLLESGLLSRAKKRGLMVFARSIYLQGLVFMPPTLIPIRLGRAKKALDGLRQLADSHNMSISELCLRYVLSISEISSAVIGMESLKQLKENIKIASLGLLDRYILKDIEKLRQMPSDLIDIRSWNQSSSFRRN